MVNCSATTLHFSILHLQLSHDLKAAQWVTEKFGEPCIIGLFDNADLTVWTRNGDQMVEDSTINLEETFEGVVSHQNLPTLAVYNANVIKLFPSGEILPKNNFLLRSKLTLYSLIEQGWGSTDLSTNDQTDPVDHQSWKN